MVRSKRNRLSTKAFKALALKICDYFLDISKLVFAGVVLGTVMGYNVNREVTLTFGVIATLIFAGIGIAFYFISKK